MIKWILPLFVLFLQCKPKTNTKNIDVSPLLKTVGENIILPNYIQLEDQVSLMHSALATLKVNPTLTNVADAKSKFLNAYKTWQKCSPYQFGPAVDEALNTINVFPTDTSQIRSNISAATYNLDAASNIDASGFPALDYLLFHQTETELLNEFNNAAFGEYILAVSEQIKTKANTVKTNWESSYLTSFISNTDLSAGSSISLLTNALVLNFEKNAREAKIGIPAGVRTLNQIVPENVEALYSGNSILLAKEHLAGFKELYEGKNGVSYRQLLVTLENETLSNNILNQILSIENALNNLTDPFDEMLENNNEPALSVYSEYQKLLPLLKVDMTAELGLLITYSDSDGD